MLHKLKTSPFSQLRVTTPKPERWTDPEFPCQDQPPDEKPRGPQPWGHPLVCGDSLGQDPEKTPVGSGGAGNVTVRVTPAWLPPAEATAPGPRPAEPPNRTGTRGQPGNAAARTRLVSSQPEGPRAPLPSCHLPTRALVVSPCFEVDDTDPQSQGHEEAAGGILSSGTFSSQVDTSLHTSTTNTPRALVGSGQMAPR